MLLGHWLLAGDLHVEPGYSKPYPSELGADTNWALLDSTVRQMQAADAHPAVVILTGDFLAHRFPDNVPLAERTMARIVRAFDRAFPRAQFVIVPGNNDDPCGDYRTTAGTRYFAYVAHLWAPLVNRNGAAPEFERTFAHYGWYRARSPLHGVEFLALNSVYWSIVYRQCGALPFDPAQQQLKWLQRTLGATSPGQRAVLVMHIPPGVDAHSTYLTHRLLVVPFWRPGITDRFVNLLQQRHSAVAFAIAGHVHRADFRFFGGVPIVITPSISPIYDNNPAFLRLDVSPAGELLNFTPIYYDDMLGEWQTASSFDRTFGIQSFSAPDLAWLHERLADDARLRAEWSRLYVAYSQKREITHSTWRAYWCAQTKTGSAFVDCAGLEERVELLPVAAGVAGVALIALAAFAGVRLGRRRARR